MAYQGFLLKINGLPGGTQWEFPLEYIAWESYKCTVGSQDVDSYRDANGILHRNALKTRVPKIEFQLRENVKSGEFDAIMSELKSRYTNTIEKKVSVTAYMQETSEYINFDSYVPDIEVTIKKATSKELIYKSIRFAFIGYGTEC